MRTFLAAAAALLAVGTAVPALAAPAISLTSLSATTVQSSIQLSDAPTAVQTKKTTKTTKKKVKETVSISSIEGAKKGKKGFEIKATVAKVGRHCELTVKYVDGSTSADETDGKSDKVCTFSIDIPNESKVIGDATAKIVVKDAAGSKVASASKMFTVK